jgi:GT2 family glycosyltransferase
MNDTYFVSIVIANYNGENYLPTCLESLLRTNYPNFEIIIVDDGSTDSSEQIVQQYSQRNEKIRVIKNSKNIGAAASRNRAISEVKGEILVFLDNDTEVTASWLTELIKTLTKSEKIGACQALLLDFENRELIQNAGVKLWAQTGWGLPSYQWQKNEGKLSEEEIIAISACLAVKKNVFEKSGGFDEQEAVVTEDLDLSWKICLVGYKILLSPSSIVYHHTKPVEERKNLRHNAQKIYFHLTKNSLLSIIKNYESQNAIRYAITSIVISLGRAVLALIKRKESASLFGTLQGFGWVVANSSGILQKRKIIQKNREVTDNELFQRVIVNDSIKNIYSKYFSQTDLV